MSYKPGALQVFPAVPKDCPNCEKHRGAVYPCGDHETHDGEFRQTRDDSNGDGYDWRDPHVALEHSCDAWIIGGPEQIKALIADLSAALKEIDG